jgi:hypothetical protein
MLYKTFHMQHICLDEMGKEFDLGAAQGSMDQSVHSSAKVLSVLSQFLVGKLW